jgi:hypothetical protein
MSTDMSKATDSLLSIYEKERAAAGSDLGKRQAADRRFIKGLQNISANDASAQILLDYFAKITGFEGKGADLLITLRNRQIEKRQDLDSTAEQSIINVLQQKALMELDLKSKPEAMKASIYSMAEAVSTVLELFGMEAEAASIRSRFADWRPNIAVSTAAIKEAKKGFEVTLGKDDLRNTVDDAIAILRTQGAVTAAGSARQAVDAVGDLPVATPVTAGAVPATAGGRAAPEKTQASPVQQSKNGWDEFKDRLVGVGLSEAEASKLMPAWKKAAAMTGDKDTLEAREVGAFLQNKTVQGLGKDKYTNVQRELTPMGAQTVTQ